MQRLIFPALVLALLQGVRHARQGGAQGPNGKAYQRALGRRGSFSRAPEPQGFGGRGGNAKRADGPRGAGARPEEGGRSQGPGAERGALAQRARGRERPRGKSRLGRGGSPCAHSTGERTPLKNAGPDIILLSVAPFGRGAPLQCGGAKSGGRQGRQGAHPTPPPKVLLYSTLTG